MPASNIYLGFDFGLKRIGVAAGQKLTGTATPLTTLLSKDEQPDWPGIQKLLDEWRPAALVVGLPYNADGTEQAITERARRFARQLEGRYGLPVFLADERFSSVAAEAEAREFRRCGGRRLDKPELDAAAASVILEAWLRNDSQQQQ